MPLRVIQTGRGLTREHEERPAASVLAEQNVRVQTVSHHADLGLGDAEPAVRHVAPLEETAHEWRSPWLYPPLITTSCPMMHIATYSALQYSSLQHNTAKHSAVQYAALQNSTVSTVRRGAA